MKKSKSRKLKGFAKLLADSRKNNSNKKPRQEIAQALTKLDAKKKDSSSQPQSLDNFLKLREEKDTEKLVEYFEQYGIDPTLARLNLDNLIAEELRDLSS